MIFVLSFISIICYQGALSDFTKEPTSSTDKKEETAEAEDAAGTEDWSNEFILQAAAQFENNMSSILANIQSEPVTDDQIQESFRKMAEAAQQVLGNPSADVGDSSADFATTISQTLQGWSDQSSINIHSSSVYKHSFSFQS